MVTALIAAIAAILGGFLARSVDILGYIQTNAKAHSDVEALQREIANIKERFTTLEHHVERLGKDNSSLVEQNNLLLIQNNSLIKQNGDLLALLGADDSTGED